MFRRKLGILIFAARFVVPAVFGAQRLTADDSPTGPAAAITRSSEQGQVHSHLDQPPSRPVYEKPFAQGPKGEEAAGKLVKELQADRITILREVADMSLKLARLSLLAPEVAAEDQLVLLKARLEVAETNPDRIALYKQTLDRLMEFEELAKAQKMAARGNELAVLRIKSRRLEVESRLEQLRVKELQKERVATLKALVEGTEWMFKYGRTSSEELYEARLLLLEGELDATEKESDRIALYANIVDVLKEYEKHADAQRVNDREPDETILKALKVVARRLEAEIHLQRAKAKEPKLSS